MNFPTLLFFGTSEDKSYLSYLKSVIPVGVKCQVQLGNPKLLLEVVMQARKYGSTQIVTTSQPLLHLLLGWSGKGTVPTIDDYAGSIFKKHDCEFLIVDPVEHIVTVPYGKFLYIRYISKFCKPDNWMKLPAFTWELFEPQNLYGILDFFEGCDFIAQDIETERTDEPFPPINCHSFTGVILGSTMETTSVRTVVIPYDSEYNYTVASALCATNVPKCFQNGKYDNAYLLRYGQPVQNWAFDTLHMFHSWYAEMPKDLGFITSFLLRDSRYWKDMSKTQDLMEYYEYNARDSYNTAMCWITLLKEVPQYAWNNYLMEFSVVFPCVLSEATGIRWDSEKAEEFKVITDKKLAINLASLRVMVDNKMYNPSSPAQTQRLFVALGSGDIKGTGKIPADKVMSRHPLNFRILKGIDTYRKDRKMATSYLKDGVAWNGRVFYSLNPHGTDTGRLASKESQFWCGLQIQNITRDPPSKGEPAIKSVFAADTEFYFGEADYSQAEAFDTAFLSGDPEFIRTITDRSTDFHGANAAKFFGVKYETIVRSSVVLNNLGEIIGWVHDTIDKALRDLAKRTNHGANYNMGAGVMLDTMGIKNVIRAKQLLGLPAAWSLLQVTQHLLNTYAKTYPVVKGDYYDSIKTAIASTGLLVGPTGWTRRCFSDPAKSKHALNSYVAHPSQSLNAMTLNKAFIKVFQNVYLPNPKDFKLHAQIHDSILFSYRKGREDLAWKVKDNMEFDTPVTDIFGVTRQLRVPVDLKGGGERWSECHALKMAA